jgi:hypothetical protein
MAVLEIGDRPRSEEVIVSPKAAPPFSLQRVLSKLLRNEHAKEHIEEVSQAESDHSGRRLLACR